MIPSAWLPSESGLYMDEYYNLIYQDGATHMDGIPEELFEVIDPHWGKFPPQHPLIAHLTGLAFLVLWVFSFVGNGLVIYIFLKTASLRTPSNMFIVNLAFSDLCMMTTMGLPVGIGIFIKRYWPWGVFACQLYGCLGAIFGTGSLMTMILIGYDRYNVIVKGFNGVKITPLKACVMLFVLWAYMIGVCTPPFFGWGAYAAEGLLVTCGYDYLKEDWNRKSFLLYAFLGNYLIPLLLIIVYYAQIVRAVVAHEATLRAQAKKMNVDSLRSGADANKESAEMKIAKVAITNVLLWFCIWTPYATINMIGQFGNKDLITPIVSQLPAFLAKMASVINPLVYAVSHPKYREALAKEVPCLGIGGGNRNKEDAETAKVSLTCKS